MTKLLRATAREQYSRDGFYFPLRALTPAEAHACQRRLERFEARQGGPLRGSHRNKCHLLFTWVDELIRHPTILDAVEDLIGPDILCWGTSFFTKEPRTTDYVSWHQDATYWGLSEPNIVTAWLAFSRSVPDNGCMRVIPGSHTRQIPHVDTFASENMLSRGQEVAVEVDEREAVDIVLDPGEFSLHHVLIVHGSGPNRSDDRRIGLAIRYIPTYVRQVAGSRDSGTLVRGRDVYGHFELEPRPARDFDPPMVALHAEITRRQAAVLYRGTDRTGRS